MVSKLQGLTTFWQEFDLPKVQGDLDEVATQITVRQDETEASKRALIEMMREFKRDKDEAVRLAAAPLIKSFQNEVDSLSKRSKAAEKAFFDVYKRLADVADPVPALEHALESQKGLAKLQDLEIEGRQLRETIGDYNKEIQEYKAKERRMAELQAKVDAYDKNIDETLNVKIRDVTERMLEEYNEKLREVETQKDELGRRATDLENKLRASQRQLQEAQSELYEAVSGKQERKDARSEEVEILLNDLEQSHERAAAAEKEAEMLRERLSAVKAEAAEEIERRSRDSEEGRLVPALNRELDAKEREVQRLLTEVQKVAAEKKKEQESSELRIVELTESLEYSAKQNSHLETKLERQADYDSIRKDLAIMKSLEFPTESGGEEDSKRPLEVMILERSKVLQSENTTLRVDRDRIGEELHQARLELSDRSRECERHQHLIAELEGHVAQLQEMSNVNRGEAEGRSSADILVDLSVGTSSSSPLNHQSMPPYSLMSPETEGGKALLPIVQAQRERFRQRNEELEEHQAKMQQQMAVLQSEVRDLRGDNVKLYEKIRFLQGFKGRNQQEYADTSAVAVENRYQSHYEQKMDPFASFSQQERLKRYGQLNVFEKIILSFVQFMMSNKFARLFVFAYSVLLHVLVFVVLMKFAYHDSYRRDLASEWHDKYMRHMEDEHGNPVDALKGR